MTKSSLSTCCKKLLQDDTYLKTTIICIQGNIQGWCCGWVCREKGNGAFIPLNLQLSSTSQILLFCVILVCSKSSHNIISINPHLVSLVPNPLIKFFVKLTEAPLWEYIICRTSGNFEAKQYNVCFLIRVVLLEVLKSATGNQDM